MDATPTGDLIALPRTPLAEAVTARLRPAVTPSVVNHSLRSYLFARLLAAHLDLAAGPDYDDDLLFAACALHDLGVSPDGPHGQRFEVEGADRAAELLLREGVPTADADLVWEAIALHTSAGIAERRGTLCRLVRQGIGLDFGIPFHGNPLHAVTDAQAAALHAAYPRLDMVRSLTDAIVAQAARNPANAPQHSVPGEFLRERENYGRTRLEHACATASRWDG